MQTGTENGAGIETGTGTKTVTGSGHVTGTGYGLWYCLCLVLPLVLPVNFPALLLRLLLVANKGILNYTSSWISRLIKCAEPHKQSGDPLPIPSPVSLPVPPPLHCDPLRRFVFENISHYFHVSFAA